MQFNVKYTKSSATQAGEQRVKWTKESANFLLGTIVVIKEDNLPPQK